MAQRRGRGHAADLRLPDRRPALRARRPPPRVRRPRARAATRIDAYVTEVRHEDRRRPLASPSPTCPLKGHERVFFERVPLPPERAGAASGSRTRGATPSWPRRVEAWGFRLSQRAPRAARPRRGGPDVVRGGLPARSSTCCASRAARAGTEAEAYLRVSAERYRLLRTHAWNEEVLDRIRPALTLRLAGDESDCAALAVEEAQLRTCRARARPPRPRGSRLAASSRATTWPVPPPGTSAVPASAASSSSSSAVHALGADGEVRVVAPSPSTRARRS